MDAKTFTAGCATSHPVAVEAGLEMLRSGGNAVDAAVAMGATLTVVEPTSNGIGGDAFAMVWEPGASRPVSLNASGRSPRGLTLEAVRKAGFEAMPEVGWYPVTVPGAPAAWVDLVRRFGWLPLKKVLAPAVRAARDGVTVEPVVGRFWRRAQEAYAAVEDPVLGSWRETFLREGESPAVGDTVCLRDHAETLEAIGETEGESFYRGDTAARIDRYSRETGGFLRLEDLASHTNDWVEALHVSYRGVELWELPPNGQGLAALIAAGILNELPPPLHLMDGEGLHRNIEAVKLAFADVTPHVADPRFMQVQPESFLSPAYLKQRREQIGDEALLPETGFSLKGGTVFLVAADDEGRMVSYIQSNDRGFGSGVVVPGTGVALQNRGWRFVLDPSSPRALAPGRRSFHTIIPGFLSQEGKPWGPMGVMGGHMQPQGHLQVLQALVDYGLSPQEALDLPRWHWEKDKHVYFEGEHNWSNALLQELRERGHDVDIDPDYRIFGRGQVILQNGDGTYTGGSEPRADGYVGML